MGQRKKAIFYYFGVDQNRNVEKGKRADVWFIEPKPDFVYDKKVNQRTCSKPGCKNEVGTQSKCGGCDFSIFYCSRECQISHWNVHKLECRKAMNPEDFWRWMLAGKCGLYNYALSRLITRLKESGHRVILEEEKLDVIVTNISPPFDKDNTLEVVNIYGPKMPAPNQGFPNLKDYDNRTYDRVNARGHQMLVLGCLSSESPFPKDLYTLKRTVLGIKLIDFTGGQYGLDEKEKGRLSTMDPKDFLPKPQIYSSMKEIEETGFFTKYEEDPFEDFTFYDEFNTINVTESNLSRDSQKTYIDFENACWIQIRDKLNIVL